MVAEALLQAQPGGALETPFRSQSARGTARISSPLHQQGSRRAGVRPATWTIELTIDQPAELFHSLDPSPLVGRDLDERVERYILEAAREHPGADLRMLVHVSGRGPPPEDGKSIADAIRNYFRTARDQEARKLRILFREGRYGLAVALAFLFLCAVIGVLAVKALPSPVGLFLEQGVLLIGWVASWRPLEIFLYAWRPLRREYKLLDQLSGMTIHFRPASTAASGIARRPLQP